ncbi:general stress protein [Actinophytocola gossypii]|uniref:Glycine zipper family protein n=1 Tax=Actinophytocola gossypii TaxID=2812003 RepID=A0ABT2JB70_9PSEU|nr:general stress protein [Actinophytocola gossypii]MCT2585111.1 glycine zipper family protein [Actinophytocola gossypii]
MTPPTEDTTQRPSVVIASYPRYADAERAVDFLSDNGFPVRHTAIVGRGLEWVEQVTGRLTALTAAGRGAASGAVAGALLGWLLGLFNWMAPVISGLLVALYGAVIGAVIGAIVGWLSHLGTGGRRDFSSVPNLRAESYDLLVEAEVSDDAARALRDHSPI